MFLYYKHAFFKDLQFPNILIKQTIGEKANNRMPRELFCTIVSLSLNIKKEGTQRVVGGDRLPVGGLPAQLLDRPDDELPLLLIQGEAVAGEDEQEKNRNHVGPRGT